LSWYFHRFVSCRDARPNPTHEILAAKGIRVITQNVDNLHVKAGHPSDRLIEIHGNIRFKRKIPATHRDELVEANWDSILETDSQPLEEGSAPNMVESDPQN